MLFLSNISDVNSHLLQPARMSSKPLLLKPGTYPGILIEGDFIFDPKWLINDTWYYADRVDTTVSNATPYPSTCLKYCSNFLFGCRF